MTRHLWVVFFDGSLAFLFPAPVRRVSRTTHPRGRPLQWGHPEAVGPKALRPTPRRQDHRCETPADGGRCTATDRGTFWFLETRAVHQKQHMQGTVPNGTVRFPVPVRDQRTSPDGAEDRPAGSAPPEAESAPKKLSGESLKASGWDRSPVGPCRSPRPEVGGGAVWHPNGTNMRYTTIHIMIIQWSVWVYTHLLVRR